MKQYFISVYPARRDSTSSLTSLPRRMQSAYKKGELKYGLWETIESRAFPGSVSNHHLGTQLGLLMAAYEMNQFKDTAGHLVDAHAQRAGGGKALLLGGGLVVADDVVLLQAHGNLGAGAVAHVDDDLVGALNELAKKSGL